MYLSCRGPTHAASGCHEGNSLLIVNRAVSDGPMVSFANSCSYSRLHCTDLSKACVYPELLGPRGRFTRRSDSQLYVKLIWDVPTARFSDPQLAQASGSDAVGSRAA